MHKRQLQTVENLVKVIYFLKVGLYWVLTGY